MSEITLDDLPTPAPGHSHVGGEILFHGFTPRDKVPRKGTGAILMPGLHCTGRRGMLRTGAGYPMTGATGERHSPRRTWTGRLPTFACTMRHSPATRGSSQGAHTASRRITPLSHAHATPTGCGLACTTIQRVALSAHQTCERSPQRAADGITRANITKEQIPVGTHIGVRHAEAHTPYPQCPHSRQGSYSRPRSPGSNQNQMGPPGHLPMSPFPRWFACVLMYSAQMEARAGFNVNKVTQ